MKTMNAIVLGGLLAGLSGWTSNAQNQIQPPLPNPAPYLEHKGFASQKPDFNLGSFSQKGKMHRQPSFTVGNKAVFVRKIEGQNKIQNDSSVTIYADDKQIGRISFWGQNRQGYGVPFKPIPDSPETLTIDEESQTVTYRKPYLANSGRQAVFSYTLKALDDSQIELSYDLGISPADLKSESGVAIYFSSRDNHLGKRLAFGGVPYVQMDRPALMAKKKSEGKPVSGDIAFAADEPKSSYTVKLPAGSKGSISEHYMKPYGQDVFDIGGRISLPRKVTDTIIIDLGEAAVRSQDAPPPVGGMDFWKMNGFHVPVSPTRNLFPNPSFEQELRYWFWGDSGWYVADTLPRYDIAAGGLFGKHALLLRTTQKKSPTLKSFPLSLDNGKTYTLSFYAKTQEGGDTGLTVALSSTARGGKFVGKNWGNVFGDIQNPEAKFRLNGEWQRYSRTFTADGAGVHVQLTGYHENVLLDGFQLETGDKPTEFVCDPIDGFLATSNPDNDLVTGDPIDATFTFTGKPGTSGTVDIVARNAYKETVFSQKCQVKIGPDGTQTIKLDFDAKKFGEGIFVVRADYHVDGFKPYTDYYRLSIMTPLSNTHATKDVMGSSGNYHAIARGEDLARKFMEWGLGSSSHGYLLRPGRPTNTRDFQRKYRITNYIHTVVSKVDGFGRELFNSEAITPELEKKIETLAYEQAKLYDPKQAFSWALACEEEGGKLVRGDKFDEYFKAQHAAARGVLKANPNAIVAPTHGTSGYSELRGYDVIEGYLKAAHKQGFKYGAIAVHPYWVIDKGTLSSYDLDEETQRLQAQMKRYGYGKETPIYYTEMFNVPWVNIPRWGAEKWGDSYRTGGSPTYDFGNREFIHAASAARLWIISLKHWPQVQSTNVWTGRPFVDIYLTPILMCKASNTLGHLMPWVEFQADIKPYPAIRGYAFTLKDGTGIAPIWTTNHDVENGLKRGPVIQVKFGQKVEFVDLMGNRRNAEPAPDGYTDVQLTPAPLFITAKDPAKLAKALQECQTSNVASTIAVSMVPTLDGAVAAKIKNLTGRQQAGAIEVAGNSVPYAVKGDGEEILTLPGAKRNRPGVMYTLNQPFNIVPKKGDALRKEWAMNYFYVPKCDGMPDWSKVPAIEMTNRYKAELFTGDNDLKASYKMAWDEKNLYLRVEAEDDTFLTSPSLWERSKSETQLYAHDGCLEVYFDCGANGRTNLAQTYDKDDYRYDFSIAKTVTSGPGQVYRLREVNWQFAGGVSMPTKEDAAAGIKNDFQRTEKGYTYTITFERRFLEPIALRKGFVAGFGLYLHDKDSKPDVGGCPKGLSLATEPGSHCDYKPHLWPLMVLEE
jgi:hypothetical protein